MSEAMFGELRSLLQQRPSQALWAEVMRWCERNVLGLEREDVAIYLGEQLKAWPDTIERFVTTVVLSKLLERAEVEHPWLAMTSGLALSTDDLRGAAGAQRLAALAEWSSAVYVSGLRVGEEELSYDFLIIDALCMLSASERWRGLKRLCLYAWLDDDSMMIVGALNFPSLEVLELQGAMQFSPDGVDAFRQGTQLPASILQMELHPERIYWDGEMECWE